MLKVNKEFLNAIVLISLGLLLSFSQGEINPRLQKKIDDAVLSTFEVDTSILKKVKVPAKLNDETAAFFGGENLFEIHNSTSCIGYLYLGEASSMKRKFDYIVMFTPEFIIKKSKVLIYREEHGKQIGSQRWLKQFIGLSLEDKPIYAKNIDAISGATISASSMTQAIGDVLKSIQILKEKDIVK